MLHLSLHPVAMLAFFQGTQLNLFERFLTQAVSGIDSTGITSGMQNVAYVVLLVGFLWQVYQSLLHGGDVRGLGTGLIKYVVTAVVVMNYGSVFTTINQGFVNGGNWVSNASGGNVLQNWAKDLQTQYNQAGFQQMWGLITGSIAGLIDGLLIIVVVKALDENSQQLAAALIDGTKIVITTLQKFPFVLRGLLRTAGAESLERATEGEKKKAHEWQEEIAKRRYAVIVDEAHSSQSGETRRELKAILGAAATEQMTRVFRPCTRHLLFTENGELVQTFPLPLIPIQKQILSLFSISPRLYD